MASENKEKIKKLINTYVVFQRNIADLQQRQKDLLIKLRKYVDEKKLKELRGQVAKSDTK